MSVSHGRALVGVTIASLVVAAVVASPKSALADAPRGSDPPYVTEARGRVAEAPRDAERALALGTALRRAGRPDDALRALQTAAALGGGRETGRLAQWEMARALVDKREVNRAIATCRGLARGPDGNAFVHVCVGEVQLSPRRAGEALAEIALGKIDGAAPIIRLRAKIVAGLAHELELKDDLAVAALREAVQMDASSGDAVFHLGRVLARTGKGGEPELRRAAQLEPNDAAVLVALARVLGPTDEAKAILDRAAVDRPNHPAAQRTLAELHLGKGRLAEAKLAAEAAIAIAPDDVVSHVVHGQVLLAQGQPAAARQSAERALAAQPNSSAAKLVVADSYAAENDIDLAIEAYQAAYGLDHTSPDPLLRASKACLAAKRATSARAFALRATQDFADFAPAWVSFGLALERDGELVAASEAYQKAVAAKDGPIDRADVEARARRTAAAGASKAASPR